MFYQKIKIRNLKKELRGKLNRTDEKSLENLREKENIFTDYKHIQLYFYEMKPNTYNKSENKQSIHAHYALFATSSERN